MTLKTRFAPSPTGLLHIGNARSAVINWAYIKSKGGEFILRIDDTDLARSKKEYGKFMTKVIIAFQGEKGAYSHLACEETFPQAIIKTCSTFEETFKIASENENYKIMVPIENSLAV